MIYCHIAPSTLTIGNTTVIWGFIYPVADVVTITLSIQPEDREWRQLTTVKNDFHTQYFYLWTPEEAGLYAVKASWEGVGIYAGTTSNLTSVLVRKLGTSLSCAVFPTTLKRADSVIVSGSIDPPLSDIPILLTFTKPGGTLVTRTVTTAGNGSFHDTFLPDVDGSWSVIASWEGDSWYDGVSSSVVEFIMNTSLLGSPGWLDDIAIIGGLGLVIVSFSLVLRFRSSRRNLRRE
jgi:hypothetical protein